MPRRKKRQNWKMNEFFVSKQKCVHCGKLVNRLPEFCRENPRRNAISEAKQPWLRPKRMRLRDGASQQEDLQ